MSVVMNEGSLDEVDWGCAEAQDEHGHSPEVPEGASRNKEASRKCKFSMMPTEMIESPPDANCSLLYNYLDLRQGKAGRPVRGAQSVADALGMQARTVMTHARHLADLGWIEIDPDPRNAIPPYSKYEFRVVHNPARKRVNPAAKTAAPRRAARRASNHPSHPSSRRPIYEATPDALTAPGVARSARVESRVERATRPPTCTAESAALSRSPRYGGGLVDDGSQWDGEDTGEEECLGECDSGQEEELSEGSVGLAARDYLFWYGDAEPVVPSSNCPTCGDDPCSCPF